MNRGYVETQFGIFERGGVYRDAIGARLVDAVERGFERAVRSLGDMKHETKLSHAGVERPLPVARNVLGPGKGSGHCQKQENKNAFHAIRPPWARICWLLSSAFELSVQFILVFQLFVVNERVNRRNERARQ